VNAPYSHVYSVCAYVCVRVGVYPILVYLLVFMYNLCVYIYIHPCVYASVCVPFLVCVWKQLCKVCQQSPYPAFLWRNSPIYDMICLNSQMEGIFGLSQHAIYATARPGDLLFDAHYSNRILSECTTFLMEPNPVWSSNDDPCFDSYMVVSTQTGLVSSSSSFVGSHTSLESSVCVPLG
jgi:hypothetical protein